MDWVSNSLEFDEKIIEIVLKFQVYLTVNSNLIKVFQGKFED